jgi:hypothetical protein
VNGNATEQAMKHQSDENTKMSDETLKVPKHQSQWRSARTSTRANGKTLEPSSKQQNKPRSTKISHKTIE